MDKPMNILGISGSLRSGSYNSAALRAAIELAPVDVSITTAGIGHLPLYDDDVRTAGMPAAVEQLRSRIAAADAVLIVTPEYNYSVPGVLKNAIDWISKTQPQPFNGKPVAIMGASQGTLGTARAQYHLRQILVSQNALVLSRPEVMIASAQTRFDAAGVLTDAATREHIAKLVAALAAWARRLGAS